MENGPPACMLIYLSGGRETGNLFGVALATALAVNPLSGRVIFVTRIITAECTIDRIYHRYYHRSMLFITLW